MYTYNSRTTQTMTTRCTRCKTEKLNNLFSIRENTGRQYKTCITCRTKSYKCGQCDYKCVDKPNLKKHIRAVHEGLKPHECRLCNYKCGIKGNLTSHIKTVHDKIKDFECTQCSAKFGHKVNLNTHIKTVHDKIKEFDCKLCGHKFGLKSGLTRHIKICTGGRRGTAGECAVMDILDKMRVNYIHDSSFEVKDTNLMRWDFQVFFEEKLIGFVEYDGKQHFEPIKFWGGQQGFENIQRRDIIKNDYCQKNNYLLLRIPYTEFANISDIVCDWIVDNTDWGFE